MSAQEFHNARQNASGAPAEGTTSGEAPEIIPLNVGTATPNLKVRTTQSSERPTEGAVRTGSTGFREVYRKVGGWAGEREPHPSDGEERIHLNNFSKKISELTPEEFSTAQAQQREYSQGMSEAVRAVKESGATGDVIDVDKLVSGGSSGQASSGSGKAAGKPKPNMVFDPLKGRMVKASEAPKATDQSYIDRLASRHPSPGVSGGDGIPAYDRHPKDIRRILNNHITMIGDFLRKADANQIKYSDVATRETYTGFSENHPLHELADMASTHHYNATQFLKRADAIKGTNSGQADELTRQAAISIHKASRIVNMPEFALAAGEWPDVSASTTETGNNLAHAVVELQHLRTSKPPKGVKLHNHVLDTSDAGNQALVSEFGKRVAEGKEPGIDRNLANKVSRWFRKTGTPLGSESWESGIDVTPMGFKGDLLASDKAATAQTGTNPFGVKLTGRGSANLKAASAPGAKPAKPQKARTKKEEVKTDSKGRARPTTKKAKEAKEKRNQASIDATASAAADSQLQDLGSEVNEVNNVRDEKKETKRTRAANRGMVFVKGPDGKPVRLMPTAKPKLRLKKKTASEIATEELGDR
jgi:hypothetical protein